MAIFSSSVTARTTCEDRRFPYPNGRATDMARDVPTSEPSQLTAGDTLRFDKTFSDFPAGESWVLSYTLNKDGKLLKIDDAEVVADGDTFEVTVAAADTAKWAAGDYIMDAFVTKASERYHAGRTKLRVLADPTTAAGQDLRSDNRKML